MSKIGLLLTVFLKVIDSITISDLEVIMTGQSEAFEPLASSQHTLATYKNPFGFSLQVVQAAEDIVLGAGDQDAAEVRSSCPCCLRALMGMSGHSLNCRSPTL